MCFSHMMCFWSPATSHHTDVYRMIQSHDTTLHFLKNFLLRRKMSRLTLTLALSNIFITATPSYCNCSRSWHTHTHTRLSSAVVKATDTHLHCCVVLKSVSGVTAHLIFQRKSLHVHTHESSLHQKTSVLLTGHDVKDHVLKPAHTHTHSQLLFSFVK